MEEKKNKNRKVTRYVIVITPREILYSLRRCRSIMLLITNEKLAAFRDKNVVYLKKPYMILS